MEYELKKGKYKELEGDGLRKILEQVFGNAWQEDDMYVTTFGALKRLETKLIGKSALYVATVSDTNTPEDVSILTIKKYNEFLEKATGFTAKERRNKLQKKAREGKL